MKMIDKGDRCMVRCDTDRVVTFFIALFISVITILPTALVSIYGLFTGLMTPIWWGDTGFFTACYLMLLTLVLVAVVSGGVLGIGVGYLIGKDKVPSFACGVVAGLGMLGIYLLTAIDVGDVVIIYHSIDAVLSLIEIVIISVGIVAYAGLISSLYRKIKCNSK